MNLHAQNYIFFLEDIEDNGEKATTIAQSVNLNQSVHLNLIHLNVTQKFTLSQLVHNKRINIHLNQELNLEHKLVKPKEGYVNNKILFSQAVSIFLEQQLNQSLSFNQTVNRSKQYENELNFQETVTMTMIKTIGVEQNINLINALGIINLNETCE